MDVNPNDDPESADAGPLDLTPRSSGPVGAAPAAARRPVKRLGPWLLAVVVVVAIGWAATGLSGATTYFYNVDDAVAKRDEIGDRRVRLQGNILDGTVDESGQGLRFTISYNSVDVPVVHTGDVPDLFGPAIPVVIEGRFTGRTFHSDRVLVKHDETYDEDNSDRIKQANADAEKNSASTTVPAP